MKVDNRNKLENIRRQTGGLILKPLKHLFGLVLRTIAASFIFYAGVAVALHCLGYPVPRISDLGRYLESLSDLTKILS
jgi:hypothetical protein